jgi:hypothetical protein
MMIQASVGGEIMMFILSSHESVLSSHECYLRVFIYAPTIIMSSVRDIDT